MQKNFKAGELMPFIENKISVKLDEEQKNTIKSRLGKAITLLGKTETYLMVGFEDGYELYLGGKKLERGAFVSVSVYAKSVPSGCEKMTAEICRILNEVAAIPSECVYVTYSALENWGWNGYNF